MSGWSHSCNIHRRRVAVPNINETIHPDNDLIGRDQPGNGDEDALSPVQHELGDSFDSMRNRIPKRRINRLWEYQMGVVVVAFYMY
jgi:hypothetical protein